MLPKTMLHCGTNEPLPKPLELRAGPLTLVFEPNTAFLRHLRLGDHEVVRAIYAAVRDRNWGTVPPQITNLKPEIQKDSFALSFDVACRQEDVDYFWQGTIAGESSGRIVYTFDGVARSKFLRNRIGLCILHPITECAGRPCVVEHEDGSQEEDTFPGHIAPHQPFLEIRALSYDVVTTGVRAELRFDGEIFETEDQRNWSDASFKTYGTPLRLPLPVAVQSGDKVKQAVTLTLKGQVRPVLPVVQGRAPQFSIATTPVLPLPPIGLCVARQGQPLTALQIERLKLLRLSHLRVDLNLASAQYPALLEEAAREAGQLDAGLHVALTVSDNAEAELRGLLEHVRRLQPRILLWLLFHQAEEVTSDRWVRLAQPILQGCAPNVLLASGTKLFFTEVNRLRPPPDALPTLVCYSNNPQVHAFDNTTLVENLAGMVSNAENAKQFSPRPVVISPITLRIRSDAEKDATGEAIRKLPSDVDPRQMSLLGAGWTLGSIGRLAATGNVHSLTYFETTGWRGVIETETGSPLPELFPSLPNAVFPVYHVLADIGEFTGRQIYPMHSSHPLQTEGLTLLDARKRRRILVANLLGETQEVKLKTGTCQARVRYLDETNAEQAMHDPESFRAQAGEMKQSVSSKIELMLLPYAIARIDIV
jgi:D-apionolactonase